MLADILHADRVTTSLTSTDKDGVLRELAELFHGVQGAQTDDVFRVFAAREALASTGVGSHVAIPHGRVAGLPSIVAALAIHHEGVPFEAVDGRPVHIFVAVLAPEKRPSDHLKALARISRLLRDRGLRERLVAAPDAESALAALLSEDRT